MSQPSVVSVNVGTVRTVDYGGEQITTSIFKMPVTGRVAVRGVNVEGDDQGNREVHGGPVRSVYAYATEDYDWWAGELGRRLEPGTFGENLTLRGADVNGALIGEQWRVGTALLQVTCPRIPCYKLAMRMDDPLFVKRFSKALRPGTYFTIVEEGNVAAGDPVEIVHRPEHRLTVAEMNRIYLFDRPRLRELLQAKELPESWSSWVQEELSA